MKSSGSRRNLSLRFQPYAGTSLAEVVDYLNSLEKRDAHRKIEDVLVMCLLGYARQQQGCNSEELRRTCLECCDTLDKHASTLRQTLRVESPLLQAGVITSPTFSSVQMVAESIKVPSAEGPSPLEATQKLNPLIESNVSIADLDNVFGDE